MPESAGATAPTPSHQQRTDRGGTHDDRPRLPARALRGARAHRLRGAGPGGPSPAPVRPRRPTGRSAGQRVGRREPRRRTAHRGHGAQRPDRPDRDLRRRERLRLVRQDRRRRRPAAPRPQPGRAHLQRTGGRCRRPQALSQDEQRGACQGSRDHRPMARHRCVQPRRGAGAGADRRSHHLPRRLPSVGRRPLRLAGLRQPGRRLRLCPRPGALRRRPGRGHAHGSGHGARRDHVHGRQGDGGTLAAGCGHRRRCGLRQRRSRDGRQEARRRSQARRRAGDPPRRRQ